MKVEFLKEVFENIIHPKMVQMAIDCTLPSDMTQLDWYYFEDEVKEYLKQNTNRFAYEKAGEILSSYDGMTLEEAVEAIVNSDKPDSTVLDFVHDDISVCETYEYDFIIESFLETIGYDVNLKK